MMSKAPRWPDLVVNNRTNTQKKGGKEQFTVPASGSGGGGKSAGSSSNSSSRSSSSSSSLLKPRSKSQSRASDATTGGSSAAAKAGDGGSLKRGSLGRRGSSQQGARRDSQPGRPSLRLCSSRSFSSLHAPSLPAAPFMRTSRSLTRLDHRATAQDSDHGVSTPDDTKGQSAVKRILNSQRLSSTERHIRDNKDVSHGDDVEKMKTSSSSEQTKDGVYTLCAMTSGKKRNWVQAVLKNVRSSPSADVTSSQPSPTPHHPESTEVVQPINQEPGQKVEGSNLGEREQEEEEEEPQPGQEGDVTPQQQQVEVEEEEDDDSSSSDRCPTLTGKDVSAIGEEPRPREGEQTVQLVRELEQTQRELSRLRQVNKDLQDEQERRSSEEVPPQSPSEQAAAVQRLQKLNHDLCAELETQKRSHEEAREAELQRRVDLLAQQAQLLVTGDATALAQAQLEQDRRRFREQRAELERRVASLASRLSASEEQREEAESRLRRELQDRRAEAERSRGLLEEAEARLRVTEEAQAEKEAQLQKHLALLQASQDRERRSLAASLEQAERRSRELQEQLDRALEQVEDLSKTRAWTQEIEEAQRQLQEELGRTVSAAQALHEEREGLERRCRELQGQRAEAEAEARRLQGRLKTDETQYYNLEHLYERACEELQVALGRAEQREAETQEMREGYERLLDGKEQELSEVLLKMEVLGNSLEETEVKLNQLLKDAEEGGRPQSGGEGNGADGDSDGPADVPDRPIEFARTGSRSVDPSHQCTVAATDDPDRFISVIQLLERKLHATEERLRDVTRRLEERQSRAGCPDPHLYAQLTQSRATAQHLGLLLHSQARQSRRFAREAEGRCRTLAGRFQVALNLVQACRNRLQAAPLGDAHLEKHLAAAAACLRQGRTDAEAQQQESRDAGRGEDKILRGDEAAAGAQSKPACPAGAGVRRCLVGEIFVIENILSVLQGHRGIAQISAAVRDDEGSAAQSYRSVVAQILALRSERKSGSNGGDGYAEAVAGRGCAEAELIYAALRIQQRSQSQENQQQAESLADVNPPELAPYEEQVKAEEDKDGEEEEAEEEEEKEPEWLQRLGARLQRRAKFLTRLCHEISDGPEIGGEDADHEADKDRMQEQAKLIYLSERLQLDLEREPRRNRAPQDKRCKGPDEPEAPAGAARQLREENGTLREELERAQLRVASAEAGNQRLLEDIQKIEDFHQERMETLENRFQEKIRELQQIHEEEMRHLHGYYTKERQRNCDSVAQHKQGEPENQGLSAAEETHRKLVGDLQQQHQAEVATLLQEKEQLLQEETAATMAAIVAMRRAHKQELEKSRQTQHIRESADLAQLRLEYEKEIQSLHKELEALSLQHTQKCLENSQLSRELQSRRGSSAQSQQENQELKKKQREKDEMSTLPFSLLNGKQSHASPQSNDFYEMEVVLRAREAEMQFLRQEAGSLREELKIARMDKIYAQNKLKALYSSGQDGHPDVNNVNSDDFNGGAWSANRDTAGQSLKEFMINPVLVKKTEKPSLTRTLRGVRSKSSKDGLSVQERMKLFESEF